jgi:hypothetical protein
MSAGDIFTRDADIEIAQLQARVQELTIENERLQAQYNDMFARVVAAGDIESCPLCGDDYNIQLPHNCSHVLELEDRLEAVTSECHSHLENLNERDGRVLELERILTAAVDCGMVPISSAKDGGAASHSLQVKVADLIRDVLVEKSDE